MTKKEAMIIVAVDVAVQFDCATNYQCSMDDLLDARDFESTLEGCKRFCLEHGMSEYDFGDWLESIKRAVERALSFED